jgi:hypothetical protein
MNASQQLIIDFLIEQIKNRASFDTCLKLCETKWNLTRSTFIRRWNDANKEYLETQQAKKSKIADNDTIKAINAEIEQLDNIKERKKFLIDLYTGAIKIKQPFVMKDKIVEYMAEANYNERIKAISELNKIDGDYAPTKVANTDTKGNDVEHYAILPDGTKLKL